MSPERADQLRIAVESQLGGVASFVLLNLLGWVRPFERDLEDENLEMRFEGNSQAAQLALSRARRSK